MQDWYVHYGMERDPFVDGGVQGLFYPGGARQEIVEQLQHLARFSDCLLIVSGRPGSGKTTVLRQFLTQCAGDTDVCRIDATLMETPEQLLRRILDGFGVTADATQDTEAALHSLVVFCDQRHRANRRTWLVMDDAQHLDNDCLSYLPRLLEMTGRQLRLILFADAQWVSVCREAFPVEVVARTFGLETFDATETVGYISYRLKTAGMEAEPPFVAGELNAIHRDAGGIPGRINVAVRKLLMESAGEVAQPLSRLPVWHFAVVAATLVALLMLYVWGSLDSGRKTELEPQPGYSRQDHSTGSNPFQQEEAAPTVVDEIAAAQENTVTTEPAVAVAANSTLGTTPTESIATANASAEAEVEEPPQSESQSPPTVSPPQPEPQPEPQPQPVESHYIYRAEGKAGGKLTAGEEYLLALNPMHFTLQVMGSDDRAKVESFARHQKLKLQAYRKLHNGRDWYALVHGDFSDRQQAEDALAGLAPAMRDMNPWVRRIDGVQKEIRQMRAL